MACCIVYLARLAASNVAPRAVLSAPRRWSARRWRRYRRTGRAFSRSSPTSPRAAEARAGRRRAARERRGAGAARARRGRWASSLPPRWPRRARRRRRASCGGGARVRLCLAEWARAAPTKHARARAVCVAGMQRAYKPAWRPQSTAIQSPCLQAPGCFDLTATASKRASPLRRRTGFPRAPAAALGVWTCSMAAAATPLRDMHRDARSWPSHSHQP